MAGIVTIRLCHVKWRISMSPSKKEDEVMMSVGSARLRLTSGLLARWRCYRQWLQERRALMEIVRRKDGHLMRDAGLSEADVRESLRVLPFLKSLISATNGCGSMANLIVSSSTPSASIVWLHTGDIAGRGGSRRSGFPGKPGCQFFDADFSLDCVTTHEKIEAEHEGQTCNEEQVVGMGHRIERQQ